MAIHERPSLASPGMRSTRGSDASNGLNGRVSKPRNPHTIVVRSLPPPSSSAVVVVPRPSTLIENGSCGGLGAKKKPGSTTLARRPGALEMTWWSPCGKITMSPSFRRTGSSPAIAAQHEPRATT